MANSGVIHPQFTVIARIIPDLITPQLQQLGCDPVSYRAETTLVFCSNAPNPSQNKSKESTLLTFRLDSGAEVSTIPEAWLDDSRNLREYLAALSAPIVVRGVSGSASCYMACGVRLRFASSATEYRWDFLISPTLNTHYGLLSLRDVRNHFDMNSDWPHPPPGLTTANSGSVRLHPA